MATTEKYTSLKKLRFTSEETAKLIKGSEF
jgi:hypothetical protein